MGFFEDSVATARSLIDEGAKKASETIEIQKIKIAISRKKSAISKGFSDLGRAYYDSCKGNGDAACLCETLVNDMDKKMLELAELDDKLAEAKKLKHCPKCGSKNSSDATFCNFCGSKLEDDSKCQCSGEPGQAEKDC